MLQRRALQHDKKNIQHNNEAEKRDSRILQSQELRPRLGESSLAHLCLLSPRLGQPGATSQLAAACPGAGSLNI
jgi:hypothetical protein